MADEADNSNGMSVTLKQDKSYEATWIRFYGSPSEIRGQIAETFGDLVDGKQEPLIDLITEATAVYHGMSNVASGLGGKVLKEPAPARGGGSAWSQAAGAPKAEPKEDEPSRDEARLLEEIESKSTIADLKMLKARNESFWNDAVDAAYKARGKAILAASK